MDTSEFYRIKERNQERERNAAFGIGSGFVERNNDMYQDPYQRSFLNRGQDFFARKQPTLDTLKVDETIRPLVEKKQAIKRRTFHKGRFLENVRDLNEKTRGLAYAKNAEKGYFTKDLYRIRAMKIRDEKGKERSLPSDIKKVLSTLEDYVSIAATARQNATQRGWNKVTILWWAFRVWTNIGGSRGKVKKEHELVAKLKKQLPDVIANYQDKPEYKAVMKELKHVYHKMIITSGTIKGTFATNDARIKAKWADYDPHTSKTMKGVGKTIKTTADTNSSQLRYVQETDVIRDRKALPLFSHRPCMEDICQGAAGNCYFLAALAAIPGDRIRDMMLDHEDGTVTVRFFKKDETTGKRQPVYVTVDKVVKINGALDCLWVQVMEKAYALFKQTLAKNRFEFKEKTVKDPVTGEEVKPEPKLISKDTIDLGFVANGGYANEVLGDLLGTHDEQIEIRTLKMKRRPSSILMDALRCRNEKGKADSRIRRLNEELQVKTENLSVIAGKVGVSPAMLFRAAEQNEVIKAYVDDYKDSKARILKEIEELEEKQQLTDQKKIEERNGVRTVPDEKGNLPYKIADEELIGMEEECEAARKAILPKLKAMGMTDELAINAAMEKAMLAVVRFPGDLIDMAVSRDRDLTTDSVSETQFLLKTLINSATLKDPFFRERTKEDGSLIDCLDGDWELATEILSKFIVPVLNKMMNNLKYVEDFSENNEIGEEDENAIQYFDRITEMLSRGQSVCCGTKENLEGNEAALSGEEVDAGMVGRHAYTVLNTTVTKDGVRMIQLRNPFASFTSDYRLNKKGKLETYANKADTNGVFWIEMSRFMKYASTIFAAGGPEPNGV